MSPRNSPTIDNPRKLTQTIAELRTLSLVIGEQITTSVVKRNR